MDIFATNANVLINPVNRVGVMGAGLALQFKQRYPQMFISYARHCRAGWPADNYDGHVFHDDSGIIIYSLPTKHHFRDTSTFTEVAAAVRALRAWSDRHPDYTIAMPHIGCGLGGLHWACVRPMILKTFHDTTDRLIMC